MKKSRMELLSKANSFDSERKISKELFKLLLIFVLTALIFQKPSAQQVDISEFELNAFDAEEIFMEIPEKDLYGNENTFLLLDSVYEFEHYGLFTEHRLWYYYYNDLNKVDSSYRYFYDKYGDYANKMEIRTFNSDGKLKKYILRYPESGFFSGISFSIEEIEEYKYKNGNLVSKIKIYNRKNSLDTLAHYFYIYNEQGKLVYDSSIYGSGWSVKHYSYDSLNRLESILHHNYYSSDWYVEKYSYEMTDTSLLTLKQFTEGIHTESGMPPAIDTITAFIRIWSNYWTFNKEGQKASLEVRYWYISSGEEKRIRAEYEYSQQGKLLHAVYYLNWLGTKYEGNWMETSHINYTYDEEGNLLVYERIMYDGRTWDWIVTNRNEYFYTPVPILLGIGKEKLTALKLYPNPVQYILNLQGNFSSDSYYKIVNPAGIIVTQGTVEKKAIDVSRLKPGLYIIVVKTDSGLHTGKFAKY